MSESEKERPSDKHADPAPPVEVPDAMRDRVRVQASPVRCPFCHDDVRVGEQSWVACAGCLARHHAGCWSEAKHCSACGDTACLAGGRSRGRGVVFAVIGGMILFLLGARAIVQREFSELRRDLREITAAPAGREDAPAPYAGETPAVAALRLAAHGGDARAAYDLSLALAAGREVVPSLKEARRWLETAADLGEVRAMKSLAAALAHPHYPEDWPKAIFWYRRALAAEYDGETAVGLARLLDEGDPERKLLLERLAREGCGEAMIELGALEPGRETLRAAAERGDAIARRQLHELEATGHFQFGSREWNASWMEQVAEPRPEEARVLLRRWAAAGDEWAKKTLEGQPHGPSHGGVLTFDND